MRAGVRLYLSVGAGGAIGSVCRYLVSLGAISIAGPTLPLGTLAVNVVGSFAIGLYYTLTEPDGRLLASPARRQFWIAGFCGGFTTFSIFSLETLQVALQSRWGLASGLVALSTLLWLVAVWFGHAIGSRINRLRGRRR